ncbi:MAG: hypothetical protein H6713_03710 [Myxococcales bacterium]|nr:hypothetical protein [Myxococcales bacterium]
MKTFQLRETWAPEDGVLRRALGRDGRRYAEVREDLFLELRTTATRERTARMKLSELPDAVAISDDGQYVALVRRDPYEVHVRTRSGRVVWRTAEGRCGSTHEDGTYELDERHVALSPEPRALLLAADERFREQTMRRLQSARRHYLFDLKGRGGPRSFEVYSNIALQEGRACWNVPDPLRSNASFSADGRWIPLCMGDASVRLWDREQARLREPATRRGARLRQKRDGDLWRWWDPVQARFVPTPRYPDPIYAQIPQLLAVSPGGPTIAWLREGLLELGALLGTDYVEHPCEAHWVRAMAIDHVGERVALAAESSVYLYSAPRRAAREIFDQQAQTLAFSPSGRLYARARDHAIYVFGEEA